jgi:hypothetical protein
MGYMRIIRICKSRISQIPQLLWKPGPYGGQQKCQKYTFMGVWGVKMGGRPPKKGRKHPKNTPKRTKKGGKKGGIKGVFEFYLLGKGGIRDPLFLITNKSWRNAIIKWYGPPVSGGRGGCGKTSLISTFFGLFRNFAHTFFRGGAKKGG